MAKITVEELYYGNERYPGIMCETTADILKNGCPAEYTEQTWLELLLVRYSLKVAEQMKKRRLSLRGRIRERSRRFFTERKKSTKIK